MDVLTLLNNSVIFTILAVNWQTNYDIHVLFKIITEAPVLISKATFSFSIFSFANTLIVNFEYYIFTEFSFLD